MNMSHHFRCACFGVFLFCGFGGGGGGLWKREGEGVGQSYLHIRAAKLS